MSRFVVIYTSCDNVMEKAPAHYPAHLEWAQRFERDGTLTMIGPFADPQTGSMAVFTTQEAAEAFVAGDPFRLNGVVADHEIREWDVD